MKKTARFLTALILTVTVIVSAGLCFRLSQPFTVDAWHRIELMITGEQPVLSENAETVQAEEGIAEAESSTEEEEAGETVSASFDTLYCPYYGMLNEEQQSLYAQLYQAAIDFTETIEPELPVTSEEAVETVTAVYYDHPELFWLDTSFTYQYTEDGQCVSVTQHFNVLAEDYSAAKSEFDKAAVAVIAEALKLNTDYEKEKYVHDAILELCEYDTEAELSQSAYSALVNGRSVCAGYSRAFQYIMTQLNIPCYYAAGTADADHAWNIVCLDGGYYNVDLTWDDSSSFRYSFFNLNDSDFGVTHTRTGVSADLPACTADVYSGLEGNGNWMEAPEHFHDHQHSPSQTGPGGGH